MWTRTLLVIGLAWGLCFSLVTVLQAEASGVSFPGIENWDATIGTINLTRTVHSLAFGDHHLYLGKGFGNGDRHIRRWDGNQWSTIGKADGQVLALLVDKDGNLYAGGYFNQIDDQIDDCNSRKRIACWNNSSWSALGNPTDGEVLSLANDSKGTLYAGGRFGVMSWNGSTWVSETITDTVYALAIDANNRVYAAGRGYFMDPDSGDQIEFPSLKVKIFGSWLDLGKAFFNIGPNGIFSLALYPANALTPTVGGDFGSPWLYLATWNQGGQSPGTLDESVLALAEDTCGGLYVGGRFSKIDNKAHKLLAYYDGTTWQSLGNTFTNDSQKLETLRFYHGYLAVGGVFTQTLGTQRHHNIALWIGRNCAQIMASGTYTFYNWREPVVIEIAKRGSLSGIRVQRYNKNHPATNSSLTPNLLNGVYWQIEGFDSSGAPAMDYAYTLTLPTVGFVSDGNDKICHHQSNTSTWDCAASTYDPVKKSITRGDLTSFSDFTVGDNVGPTFVRMHPIRVVAQKNSLAFLVMLILLVGWFSYRRLK